MSTSSWRPASAGGSMRRCASAPGMTQADLLRGRGELGQARGRFDAQLPKVRPIVRHPTSKPSISRIGMDVVSGKEQSGLIVADIDKSTFGKTPVAKYNFSEQRQAVRSQEEEHASFAIQPGDRIRAIRAEDPDKSLSDLSCILEGKESFDGKKSMSQTAMLAELRQATSETSPRCVNLQVSRNLEDVLRPLINSGDLDSSQKFAAPETNLTKPTKATSSSTSSHGRAASPSVFNMSDDELFSMPTRPSRLAPRASSRQSSARPTEADPLPHLVLGKRGLDGDGETF
mmetsp:Transcript_63672/g.120546  ORF Transcript_63672/g.120546 Transcript_63672/m.120546 type:complete len:287 (+) Transcript_63672:56-916(+)